MSLSKEHFDLLDSKLRQILAHEGEDEIKWAELRTDFDLRVTQKCFAQIFEYLKLALIRCDTLAWDTEDSRHKILGRDDRANLARMYYHLFRNVLRSRWPDESVWAIYPDENSALNWTELRDILTTQSYSLAPIPEIRTLHDFRLALRREFVIVELVECRSIAEPLVQMADILAGVAVFSRVCYQKYLQWEEATSPQETLFPASSPAALSNSERRRCIFLKALLDFARRNKLQLGFASSRGLKSYRPEMPLNFWRYVPQNELDRAPTS